MTDWTAKWVPTDERVITVTSTDGFVTIYDTVNPEDGYCSIDGTTYCIISIDSPTTMTIAREFRPRGSDQQEADFARTRTYLKKIRSGWTPYEPS